MAEQQSNPLDILAALDGDTEGVTNDGTGSTEAAAEGSGSADADAGGELAGESSGDASAEAGSETPDLILGKFRDQAALEEAYKNAERKITEEANTRRQYELYLQQLHEENQQQEQFAPIGEPQSMDDLIAMTYDDPDAAVGFAAERAPHLMNKVIATIRQFDADQAERHLMWYQDYKMEQRLAEMQQPIHQMQAQAVAQQTLAQVSSLPGFNELREEIKSVIRERPHWFNVGSPEQLAGALRDAYELAKLRNPEKIQQATNAVNQARQDTLTNATVETGSHSTQQVDDDLTPEEEIRQAIFAQASKLSL